MTMTTLWRAAADGCCHTGSTCFAARRADAEAYLDNGGLGGPVLYRAEVEIDSSTVLDLTEGQPEWLAQMIDALGAATECWAVTACGRITDAIVERGYRWVRFTDSYPDDCETWARLSDASGADWEIEDAMVEAE